MSSKVKYHTILFSSKYVFLQQHPSASLGCWVLQFPQCSCGGSWAKDGGEGAEAQGGGESPAAARGGPAGAGQGRPPGAQQAVGGAAEKEGQVGGVQAAGAIGK